MKLKSIIEGVGSNSDYSCYRKLKMVTDNNYLPINFAGGEHCPGSDGEVEFRYDIGQKWAASFGTCAKPCNSNADCPTPPEGTTATCDAFYKRCFVACSQDFDCQAGARCTFDEICSYQMSTARRILPSARHYGYPDYNKIRVGSEEDACYEDSIRVWYPMKNLFIICQKPCTQDSDCPTGHAPGAQTRPVCIHVGHGIGSGCYIPCSSTSDCQDGAVCLRNYNPSRCAFPI